MFYLPSAWITALCRRVRQDKVALLKPSPETAEQCTTKTITTFYSSYFLIFKCKFFAGIWILNSKQASEGVSYLTAWKDFQSLAFGKGESSTVLYN